MYHRIINYEETISLHLLAYANCYDDQVIGGVFYELNLDTENWTKKKGPRKGAGGMHPGAGNLQKDNFDKRFVANQQRWFKSIAPNLDKLAKDGEWEKVFLIGDGEAVHELKKQMNKDIDQIVYKNMLHHKETEVLAEISA